MNRRELPQIFPLEAAPNMATAEVSEIISPDSKPKTSEGQQVQEELGAIKKLLDLSDEAVAKEEPLTEADIEVLIELFQKKEGLETSPTKFLQKNEDYSLKFYEVFHKLESMGLAKLLIRLEKTKPDQGEILFLTFLAFSTNSETARQAHAILDEKFEPFLASQEKLDESLRAIYRGAYVLGMKATDQKLHKLEIDLYKASQNSKDMKDLEVSLMPAFLSGTMSRVKELGQKTLNRFCLSYDLPTEQVQKAWLANSEVPFRGKRTRKPVLPHEQGDLAMVFRKNLLLLTNLERSSPGICSNLFKKFGILNFGRFNDEVWLKQEAEKDKDMPYVLVVCGESDWNAASFDDSASTTYLELLQSLKGKFALRIIEAGDKLKLAKVIRELKKSYKIRPAAVIFNGHGLKEFVLGPARYGKKHLRNYLSPKMMPDPRLDSYIDLGNEDTTFIFDSCGVDRPNTFTSHLSSSTGNKVIFPNGSSSVKSFNPTISSDGQLSFRVKYNHGVRKVELKDSAERFVQELGY